ncbi:hypothetical protein [Spiroplasma endosymbiont of Labia minor]|uniref:hypothetical protein n=1 Tax=Spiroplasma endosymbiont of Labia minor TaxID=3066305 RepID=UPI0030D60F0B
MKILLNLLSTVSLISGGASGVVISNNSYATMFSSFYSSSIYKLTDEGKIDTSVGDGTGILEDKTLKGPTASITEFSNNMIIATINLNDTSVYKLTDEGKIDTSVGAGTGIIYQSPSAIRTVIQLSNGLILAGTVSNSIYKLNDDGTIANIIENQTFDGPVYSITQLSNGTILAATRNSTGTSIYKLNQNGTINSIVAKIMADRIISITQLSNGTILASTSNLLGEIYKLNSDGTFNSVIESGTLDGILHTIMQLSNGLILAGTDRGSIYKLTDEGKIDTSVGDGTGKLEDKTLDSGILSLVELSNGIILAGTSWTFH